MATNVLLKFVIAECCSVINLDALPKFLNSLVLLCFMEMTYFPTCEFSKLKLILLYLRASMRQDCLSALLQMKKKKCYVNQLA